MRRALLTISLAAALAPGVALACRCREPALAAAYRSADAVVLGKVLSARDPDPSRTIYSIQVRRSWKLRSPAQVQVESGTTCRIQAPLGADYLLFLKRDASGGFFTTRCMGDRSNPGSQLVEAVDRESARRAR